MAANGDNGKRMFYLKMDIEGAELEVLPELLESGVLDRVDQLALEFHLEEIHEKQRWLSISHSFSLSESVKPQTMRILPNYSSY